MGLRWNRMIRPQRMALSAIRLRIADHVLVYVSGAKTAADTWKTLLRDTYEPSGPIGVVLCGDCGSTPLGGMRNLSGLFVLFLFFFRDLKHDRRCI
jgi:hypothetical protein